MYNKSTTQLLFNYSQNHILVTALLKYQNEEILKSEFIGVIINTNNIQDFMYPNLFAKEEELKWLISQIDNSLPNQSSGSFYTALTDIDNLLAPYGGTVEDKELEYLYDFATKLSAIYNW